MNMRIGYTKKFLEEVSYTNHASLITETYLGTGFLLCGIYYPLIASHSLNQFSRMICRKYDGKTITHFVNRESISADNKFEVQGEEGLKNIKNLFTDFYEI